MSETLVTDCHTAQRDDNAVGYSVITERVRGMVTLWACFRDMPGSNLGTIVSCPELDAVWFFLILSKKNTGCYLYLATIISCQILCNL